MIIKEIEVSAGQSVYFGQRFIHKLCIKRFAAVIKSIFVAKIAVMRTASRHHQGIRDKIFFPG